MNPSSKDIFTFPVYKNEPQSISSRLRPKFIPRHLTKLYLIAFVLFSLAISAFVLSHQSLRLDESQSLWQSSRSPADVLNIIAQDVHVPLYGIVLHFWQLFLGNSIIGARMLSLVFFLASIPLTYHLGRVAYNKQVGLFSAMLITVSPFLNWYGNEIRMYSLMTFFALLNQYYFVKLFKRQNLEKSAPAKIWMLYAVTALLGIYTHYFFWLILLSQGVFFVMYRKKFAKNSFKNLAIIAMILFLAISPWIYYVINLNKVSNAVPILLKPTSINLFNTFSQFMFGFQDDHLNTLIISLWPLSVVFLFLSLRKSQKISPLTTYFLISALLPIVMAFVISTVYKPLFITRYLSLAVPSLYIFLAWFFSIYPPKASLALKSFLVICMLATLYIQVRANDTPVKENYKEASKYLDQKAQAQDIIIVSAPFTVYPVEYYYTGPSGIVTLPLWNRFIVGPIPLFSEADLPKEVDQIKTGHDRAFLLLSYDQGYEYKLKYYFDTHFPLLEEKNFSPKLDLYVYQMNKNGSPSNFSDINH